jgi:RNA polymerase sigma factor for flagellar operon FliA
MGAKANANGKAPLPAKGKRSAKPAPAMKSSGSAKASPAIKVVPSLKPAAKASGRSVAVLPEPARPPMDELAALWAEFKATASPQARERLILHYAPLVKYVASRVATGLPASVEQADLVSYGMFGLIDALEKFEPARGNKFETYAIPRIKGAIIDELRAMDWVPRSVRFKARQIEKAYSDLESIMKRAPSEKEVAARLGFTLKELHDVITQISFVSVLALDELLSVGSDRGEQVSLLDTLADRGSDVSMGLEGQETRGLLAAAINSLSEREKIVVTLYYFEGLTLAEIGEILGVTESRVCQIHTKAVNQLRLQFVETE